MTIPQTEPGVGFDDLRRTGGPSSRPGPTKTHDPATTAPQQAPRRVDPAISSAIRDRARAQLAAAHGRNLGDQPALEEHQPGEPAGALTEEPAPDDELAADLYADAEVVEDLDAGQQPPVDEGFAATDSVESPTQLDQVAGRGPAQVDDRVLQVEAQRLGPEGAAGQHLEVGRQVEAGRGRRVSSSVSADLVVPGGGPAVTQDPVPRRGYDVDLSPTETSRPTRASYGWRARFGLRPSQAEIRDLSLKRAMNVNFGRPVNIVLANPRGYAGKTSLTLGLAGALGRARAGGVCAFEDHELRGTMALRVLSNGTTRTIRDFIDDLSSLTPGQVRHADLHRYLRHQDSGQFDAMVTSSEEEEQLTGEEFRAGLTLLARFYQAIVVDTANNEAHEAFRAAVESATVLVVPIKWRRTHVRPAIQMLKDMAGRSPHHERLVRNAVIVASHAGGELIGEDRNEWLPFFTDRAHAVIEIGTDPHISADRPIVHDQLTQATQISLDRLGAAVCSAAMTNINEEEEAGR